MSLTSQRPQLLNGEKMLNFTFTLDLVPERKLMVAKIYGIWKKETAQAYHQEYMEAVKPLLGDKWAKLTNLYNWKASYPEINDILGEHMRWCQENGAVFSVYVIDNPVTHGQLKKMFKVGHVGQISTVFKTQDEAERFLAQNGF